MLDDEGGIRLFNKCYLVYILVPEAEDSLNWDLEYFLKTRTLLYKVINSPCSRNLLSVEKMKK